jgi:CheY-like chemotaxis protein
LADSEKPLAGKRCLVLDDEWLIALDIQAILETAGAMVVCAGNVGEALALLQQQPAFDLAVLDVLLGRPIGTSLSVAHMLFDQRVPFVFLTGMQGEDFAHAAQFPGAPVVEKPYQAKVLLDAIARALAGN